MRCKICGTECPPGAKICRDCAAARKRAFAATVTLPLLAGVGVPSVGAPRFAPKPARSRPPVAPALDREPSRPEPTPALPLNVVPKSLGVHWLLIGVAIAATIVVLLLKVLTAGNGHVADDAGAAAPSAPQPPVVAAPTPPPAAPTDSNVAQGAAATVMSVNGAPPPKSPSVKPVRKAATRPEPPATVVAPPPAPEPAPIVRAPAPPRVVEAPRDPWQVMNEGLSRCAREDLFSRIACEQRLRLQYCPNYWGVVPQCPIGATTEHGQ